ncbi:MULTISPECIES: NAD-dependent epimerase/dehydratase family protein [unclassified Streptomyces]|uniref:NAD-dependent epimerase/dehydratase family protein n=1 Tax=unclassified Streptomyces TaxID=2593676 RepID=UPI00099F6C38|nr:MULTISPECIES: NAD-dependent epimerase/dehydratase family protein [unclassified Streptomyces]MCP3769891.1 NAD-dependent epimerase/dehydratase family protein [Streptomyces sp. MAR25Y5]
MVKTVVVTGGSGMLGGNLVRSLAASGMRVRSLDVRPPAEQVPGVDHVTADVRDPGRVRAALSGADAVVHTAAALPSYPEHEIRSIIVDGTRTVLRAAEDTGLERVVHISSTAVYGLPDVVPTTEDYPRSPVDAYSRAKAGAEEVVEEFRARGLCVPVLRPKTFVGPGRMGLFAMLFEWAEEGRNFPVLGRGDVRIQMFSVDDLVDAVATTLDAPAEVADDTFNLAAAEFGTLREDFQAVLDAAGHGKRVISIPAAPAVMTLDLLSRLRLSPVYGRLTHKLRADSYVSIDKAQKVLGWTPRFSNSEAILSTYEWWRATRSTSGATASTGRTSREPWKQGALGLAKAFF